MANLTYLDINSNTLTGEGIKHILKLDKLTHFYVGWNQVSYYGSRWCIK